MKILYAIQGTGNGHLSRAVDIVPELKKFGNLDLFVSGAQGFIVQAALMPDFDRERYLTTLDKYLPR